MVTISGTTIRFVIVRSIQEETEEEVPVKRLRRIESGDVGIRGIFWGEMMMKNEVMNNSIVSNCDKRIGEEV